MKKYCLLATVCCLITTAVGQGQVGAEPLVMATIASVNDVREVQYVVHESTNGRAIKRQSILMTLQVSHSFSGELAPSCVEVAVDVRAIYKTTWTPAKRADALPLQGRRILIGLQKPDGEGRFWLRAADRGGREFGVHGYSTSQVTVPYASGEDATYFELGVMDFDRSLPADLHLCDLFVRNALTDSKYANVLIQLSGTYREAKATGGTSLPNRQMWRSHILSMFATDRRWRSTAALGTYYRMLLAWDDSSIVDECKAEIRRDPDCTIFGGGFPHIDDDELKLDVLKQAQPRVARNLMEARGQDAWDRKLLRIALDRLGDDPKLDLRILVAATRITNAPDLLPSENRLTGEVSPQDLRACTERAQIAIRRYLNLS